MGHLHIAVIVKNDYGSGLQTEREFLVHKERGKEPKFFEAEGLPINGGFEFTWFLNQVIGFLELNEESDKDQENERNIPSESHSRDYLSFHSFRLFKTSRRNPTSTSYKYSLSSNQAFLVDSKIKQAEGKWNNLKWIKEKDLLKQRNTWADTQQFIFHSEEPFRNPKFSNSLKASFRNLAEALRGGKLVVFAGAGVSIDSGAPSWKELIDSLKQDLDTVQEDYLATANTYQNERGKKEYYDRVNQALKVQGSEPNSLHERILALKPLHIVTTNYDPYFDKLIEEKNYRYSIVKKDNDLPYSRHSSLYVKMHGDLQEKNIVLTKHDYDFYSERFPLIRGFVQGIFASKLVLFVGFSLTDDNLNQIIDSVHQVLKGDSPRPYLFTLEGSDKSDEVESYQDEKFDKIQMVSFEQAISEYYEQIADADDIERIRSLSDKGKKVYHFLRVLEKYDPFTDGLADMKVESQLVTSLSRFKSLGALPPRMLEKITPFRLKRQALNEQSSDAVYGWNAPYALETLNEELLESLRKRTDKKGVLLIDSESDNSFDIEFNIVLGLLYNSCVNSIIRKNDTSPLRIDIKRKKNEQKCNCTRCLADRLEFDTLLEDLNGYTTSLCEVSSTDDELFTAYGFFQTGQYVKAFYSLEKLKNKGIRRSDYVIYFIASYNQKLLYPFTSWMDNRQYDEEHLDRIQDRISQIDLDGILTEVPMDETVRETLKQIRDNQIYKDAIRDVKSDYAKIIENYTKYKKGGYRSIGPLYWYKVETTVYRLFQFYHSNLLYNSWFDYFENLTELYVESMLASYSTSPEYNQRMEKFSEFFVWLAIRHLKSGKLADFFDHYEIDKLRFDKVKTVRENLIESFTSLCESGYSENSFFDRRAYANPRLKRAISESDVFSYHIKRLFNNFLIVFTRLELTKERIARVSNMALNYVETAKNFNAHGDLKEFSYFMTRNIKQLDLDTTTRLIRFILSDNIWSDAIIPEMCSAIINNQKSESFLKEDVFTMMLNRSTKRPFHNVRIESFIPLFPLFEQSEKDKFKAELETALKRTDHAKTAYYWGMWTPRSDSKLFNQFTAEVVRKSKQFPDFEIGDNGLPQTINSFDVWNDLMFLTTRVYQFDLFDSDFVGKLIHTIDSRMYQWVLAPESFDYSQFNYRWVLVFNSEYFTKRLKKISPLAKSVESSLVIEYNSKVAEVYYRHYR